MNLAAIIAECKARPRRVVVPAGVPGPDGQTRPYAIHDDAFDLIFDEEDQMGFEQSQTVEQKGWAEIKPFILSTVSEVEELWDNPVAQESGFDLRWRTKAGVGQRVECKFEELDRPNFFIELLSNLKCSGWEEYGWAYKTEADVLLYYFLDTHILHVLNMQPFLKWACGYEKVRGAGMDKDVGYAPQRKTVQLNHSLGMLMPIFKVQEAAVPGVNLKSMRITPGTAKWEPVRLSDPNPPHRAA